MIETATEQNDESIICFKEGVIGVPRARRFQLTERPDSAIRVLRCLDLTGFDLPVVDPRRIDPEYRPRLGRRIVRLLELEGDEPVLLLAVTALHPAGPQANLRAPVVINVRRRLAAQVILEDRRYPLSVPVGEAAAAVV